MKKKIARLAMVLLLVIHAALALAQVNVSIPEDEKEVTGQFSRLLEDLRRDLKIPGLSAAIVKDDNVLWSEGFGYADLENKIKATPETSYYLASLTKTFTSTIILQLVEQGKLDLDAPISRFGIRVNSPGVITVRHLLSHTSEGQPGTFYSYNGYRFSFLGQVIQRASGRSFRELVVENILNPLHMTGTAPNVTGKSDADTPFAQAYEKRTQPYGLDANGQVVKGRYETDFLASGGLISTVLDMAKYDIAISQNRFLRPESQEMAFAPFVSGDGRQFPYGLGWFTQEYNGVQLIWHYGYYPPCESTLILKAPDEKMTLIVLANMDSLSRPFPLGGGDVLTSPLAVVFFRMFIYPRITGKDLAPVNWKSSPEVIISQLKQEEDEQAVELYKKELMAYWRVCDSMGPKETAAGLMKAYSDLFSKAAPTAYHGQPVIAEISNVGDKVYRVVEFTLERDTPVRIYGIGEGNSTEMYDFGGIENTRTGELIWLMDYTGTIHAGGDAANRLVNKVTSLPQGTYRLHFKTDKNHSFERWMSFPPDHAFWGIFVYEEGSTGTGDMAASRRRAVIIPPEEITPSQRLLDLATAGQRQESVVNPALKLTLTICGVIFLLAIIIWPIGTLIRFLKSCKLKTATISKKKSRLSAAGTFIAWVNGILGLFYVIVAVAKGALELLLTNGFVVTQADVKLIFVILPLVFAFILALLVGLTFLEWKKRYRSPIGRWFFTLFTTASIAFVLLCAHYYLLLFV